MAKVGDINGEAISYADCAWVTANIENFDVVETEAPTTTAWGLLVRARDEKSKVYEWVLNHVAPKSYITEDANRWERDPARKLIHIEEKILETAGV